MLGKINKEILLALKTGKVSFVDVSFYDKKGDRLYTEMHRLDEKNVLKSKAESLLYKGCSISEYFNNVTIIEIKEMVMCMANEIIRLREDGLYSCLGETEILVTRIRERRIRD